jgi:hypothetical protein
MNAMRAGWTKVTAAAWTAVLEAVPGAVNL